MFNINPRFKVYIVLVKVYINQKYYFEVNITDTLLIVIALNKSEMRMLCV